MIGKIKYIADLSNCEYERGTFDEFIVWLWRQLSVQIDIETDITNWWNTRKLISIQFGSVGWQQERTQWFLQWSELSDEQKLQIKEYLECQTRCKYAHNVTFEYVVLAFHGIILENVYDTMLAEKVLLGGDDTGDYALADISWKYLRILMDKHEQTNFGDNIITPNKIKYAITDVAYLDVIRRQQLQEAAAEGLMNVLGLEMEAVLAFGDITFNGMKFDYDKWKENIKLAEPIVEEKTKIINAWLSVEPLKSYAISKGYISDEDRCTINYNSHQQKGKLLQLIFPDIVGAGLPVLKKYIRDNAMHLGPEKLELLQDMLDKEYTKFQQYLLTNHREYLIENGTDDNKFLIPANTITINWNSNQQVLGLFQLLIPKLNGLGEEERDRHVHKILKDYEEYKKAIGLITRYGESWIEKYVGPDGYVRTNFNQVLTTGRVSSSNPNMQNVQVNEEVGTRYRNCFVAEPGWSYVDSDYTGQELALIAFISNDPVWLGAIERGEDIHSIVAEMMFANKWKDGKEENCAYYAMKINPEGKLVQAKQKCSCKKHKVLRYDSKAIDFG